MSDNYLLVDGAGKATEIKGDTKIGRSKTNDVVLIDQLASRHHATIYFEGDVLMIRDEQSVNGTIVNRSQIYDPVVLKDKDTIQFGDEIFTVRAPLAEAKTMLKSEKEVEKMISKSGDDPATPKTAAKKSQSTKAPVTKAPPKKAAELVSEMPKPPKKAAEPAPPVQAIRQQMEAEEPPKKTDNKKILIIAGAAVLVLCVCCIVTIVIYQQVSGGGSLF